MHELRANKSNPLKSMIKEMTFCEMIFAQKKSKATNEMNDCVPKYS